MFRCSIYRLAEELGWKIRYSHLYQSNKQLREIFINMYIIFGCTDIRQQKHKQNNQQYKLKLKRFSLHIAHVFIEYKYIIRINTF